MKLAEIITLNMDGKKAILFEKVQPYLKSLNVYYSGYFRGEPLLMVTSITNATQYVKIVDSYDFNEAICEYIGCEDIENENNEDKINERETIQFNSRMLKDLIN